MPKLRNSSSLIDIGRQNVEIALAFVNIAHQSIEIPLGSFILDAKVLKFLGYCLYSTLQPEKEKRYCQLKRQICHTNTSTGRQGRLIGSFCIYSWRPRMAQRVNDDDDHHHVSFIIHHSSSASSSRLKGAQNSPPLKKNDFYRRGVIKRKILIPTLHEKQKKKRFPRSMGSKISRLTTPLT